MAWDALNALVRALTFSNSHSTCSIWSGPPVHLRFCRQCSRTSRRILRLRGPRRRHLLVSAIQLEALPLLWTRVVSISLQRFRQDIGLLSNQVRKMLCSSWCRLPRGFLRQQPFCSLSGSDLFQLLSQLQYFWVGLSLSSMRIQLLPIPLRR